MKKMLKAGLAMLCAMLTLVSCGVGGRQDAPPEADPTFRPAVTLKAFAATSQISLFNRDIAEYQEIEPNVRVEGQFISDENYDDTMAVWLASSSSVDVVWARSKGLVKEYMRRGFLQEIDVSDIPEAALTSMEGALAGVRDAEGEHYGIPFVSNCWMLFYNQDLFEENGVALPAYMTWEEYRELADTLTDSTHWGGLIPLETLNLGAIAAGEYLDQEDVLVKTKDYVTLLEQMFLEDQSHIPVSELSRYDFDFIDRFAQGDVYMMISRDTILQSMIEEELPFTFAMAPLPVMEGVEEGSTVGGSSYLCTTVKSEHPEEASDFIRFCCMSDEGTINIVLDLQVPACYTAVSLDIYNDSISVEGIEYRFTAGICDELGEDVQYSRLETVFTEEMTSCLNGEQGLDDAFISFYARKDYILG